MRYSRQRRRSCRERTVLVPLDEIHVPDRTCKKILGRDTGQIERMRQEFEAGRSMVRVILRHRLGGGYDIEDGRHRVIAASLAGLELLEAIIVGD